MFSDQGMTITIDGNFSEKEIKDINEIIDLILINVDRKVKDQNLRRGVFRALKPSTFFVLLDKESIFICLQKSFGLTSVKYVKNEHLILDANEAYEGMILDIGFDDPILFKVPQEYLSWDPDKKEDFISLLADEHITDERNKFIMKNQLIKINPIFGSFNIVLNPSLVFVLMPFEDSLTDIYESIVKPSVEGLTDGNLVCRRGDDFKTNKAIIQDIWKAICEAKIVIADLTGLNPNVMYELGIAHTVGKDTILIYQKTENEVKFPFDLAHIRRIEYANTAVGAKKLEKELIETIRNIIYPKVI